MYYFLKKFAYLGTLITLMVLFLSIFPTTQCSGFVGRANFLVNHVPPFVILIFYSLSWHALVIQNKLTGEHNLILYRAAQFNKEFLCTYCMPKFAYLNFVDKWYLRFLRREINVNVI
jgi:hypothetical protein